ncbi:MAG: CDP-alcohol phosphatidyltransferase family protein, partial [Lactobacillus iners]|nr:CDP-alcohol phosphatidyltransferase family protein [Lactobacillus iners]
MNLPNKLTTLRIFMIPVFILLLIFQWPAGFLLLGSTKIFWCNLVAAIVFALASFTDYLDGHIARKRG